MCLTCFGDYLRRERDSNFLRDPWRVWRQTTAGINFYISSRSVESRRSLQQRATSPCSPCPKQNPTCLHSIRADAWALTQLASRQPFARGYIYIYVFVVLFHICIYLLYITYIIHIYIYTYMITLGICIYNIYI